MEKEMLEMGKLVEMAFLGNNVLDALENELSKLRWKIFKKAEDFLSSVLLGWKSKSIGKLTDPKDIENFHWAILVLDAMGIANKEIPNTIQELEETISKIISGTEVQEEKIAKLKKFFEMLENIAIAESAHPICKYLEC